jgi:hypothetical protein
VGTVGMRVTPMDDTCDPRGENADGHANGMGVGTCGGVAIGTVRNSGDKDEDGRRKGRAEDGKREGKDKEGRTNARRESENDVDAARIVTDSDATMNASGRTCIWCVQNDASVANGATVGWGTRVCAHVNPESATCVDDACSASAM